MEEFKDFTGDPAFLEFLNGEFNGIAVNATTEELAEFAFGSLEEAIKAFDNYKRN